MNIYCEYEKLLKTNNNGKNFSIKKTKKANNTTITEINLQNFKLAKNLDKKEGIYTTIYCKDFDYLSNKHFCFLSKILEKEIKKLLKKIKIKNIHYPKFFIVGLGNSEIIADCLGVYVCEKIISTKKDIDCNNLSKKYFGNVFSIAPSISNKNGIYTYEIVKSLSESLKPDIVILIDSLSCKNINSIFKTFQLNTIGLTPGCDIGNKQPSITKNSLSIPVISIGCPTVINLKDITNKNNNNSNPVLTIKDVDIAIKKCAEIISFSLNKVIHKNLSDNEIIYLTKK